MTYIGAIVTIAVIGAFAIWEGRRAPELWVCGRCQHTHLAHPAASRFCPVCGEERPADE